MPAGLSALDAPPRRRAPAILLVSLIALLAAPVVLRSLAEEAQPASPTSALLVASALVVLAVGGVVAAFAWNRVVDGVGNEGLAIIGLLAGLQFATSYASRIVGYVAGALTGPFYLFIDGVGSRGLACLFLGALVTLRPRPGVLALALLTVFTLNGVTTGQLGLTSLLFVGVSVVIHEVLAAILGVTTAHSASRGRANPAWGTIVRTALALGLANALALYVQYALFEVLLRQYYAAWFKLSVAGVTGLLYGGIGAGCGAALGLRLRRIMP